MGLAVCDEERGVFCCQRDFDCCANSTLHLYLGKGEPIRFLARPTSAAEPEEADSEPTTKKGRNHGRDLVIGVASGFSIAAGLAIIGWIAILLFRRRKLLQRASGTGGSKKADSETGTSTMGFAKAELDATETAGDPGKSEWRIGGSKNPVELDSEGSGRSELETVPTSGTRSTADTYWTVSPLTATATSPRSLTERDYFATLVTPVVLEMPVKGFEDRLDEKSTFSNTNTKVDKGKERASEDEAEVNGDPKAAEDKAEDKNQPAKG
jgi:hypothetical protein